MKVKKTTEIRRPWVTDKGERNGAPPGGGGEVLVLGSVRRVGHGIVGVGLSRFSGLVWKSELTIHVSDIDMHLDGVVLEATLVGVSAATDGTLVLFVGCLLDVVLVVPHVVVEIGHLSKCPVTTIKTTAVRLLPCVNSKVLL